MRIVERYSHLNGWEFLWVHRRELWQEVLEVIACVDAEACKDKVSKEKTSQGRLLYSPKSMNNAFARGFKVRGWQKQRQSFFVTSDAKVLREVYRWCYWALRLKVPPHLGPPLSCIEKAVFLGWRQAEFGRYALPNAQPN